MNNYAESKKKLDAIRQKYGCAGEVIFRTAISNVVEYGRRTMRDTDWYNRTMDGIDLCHDNAEANGNWLLMTREFEKAIVDCGVELCDVDTYHLLMYVQKEMWFGGLVGEPDYRRAIGLLKRCIECIDEHHEEISDVLVELYCIGFKDCEIDHLGYGYLLDEDDEEE